MADVFISYRNTPSRRAIVRRLATALRVHDLSVWWDRGLEAGQNYEAEIRRELQEARVIVPLWCMESVMSRWVLEKARTGLERGVLFPALLQNVTLPDEFARIQAHDFVGWSGSIASTQLSEFIKAIGLRLGKRTSIPIDLLEDLGSLEAVGALESTKEVVDGESFTVYSNYILFGNEQHADVIQLSSASVDLMGISLMSFHRESDRPLGDALGRRAAEGLPIRALLIDPANRTGLSQIIQDPERLVPRISEEIERSFAAWMELSRAFPNVQCRKLGSAIIRQIATITPEKAVVTPYWYAAPASNERPTLVCRSNSVFYKLVRAEFDAQWQIAT